MIDDTNYADCLALYNFNHADKIKGKESFSYIFNDNINYIRSLYNRGKIRNVTYDTIQKTILCGSIYLGYDFFVCPHCGNESIVPHKCHSKLCTSCGTKETKLRAAHISSITLDAKHRHIVFTIPKHLRGYFTKDRFLLSFLLIAAINTLACVFNDAKYRKMKKPNAPTLIKMTETRSSSVLFWLYILLAEIWNGIPISTALFAKKLLIAKKIKWRTFLLFPVKNSERLGCIRSLIFSQNKNL